ncbi:MAG: hypothetical protein SWJ54_15315 [Cyanobacteriota bacterium]|nr:hypothetical protein [Cyanobacteriota bacterium]
MAVVICPGIHDPRFTESFLSNIYSDWQRLCQSGSLFIVPARNYSAYSGIDIFNYLCNQLTIADSSQNSTKLPILFISFSAGVVGAIAAAWMWQQSGGEVKALIALDGWGVPLAGNFPLYRISHDYFTHWSSALLGGGIESFYANPSVDHLDLWRVPQTARGWWLHQTSTGVETASPATATTVISDWLTRHNESQNLKNSVVR